MMQNRNDRAKPVKPQRVGLLVLGMHRAGTSATTRLLSLLGADLPATLIGASPHNQSGYWESRAVREFNDRLLASAGSRWNDWRAVGPGWMASAKAEEFRDEATLLLASEIGTSRFFVLKDPRICRLAPFWCDVLENSGVTPHAVIVLRNPLEVAASLGARNGFAPEFSYLLWLRHMLDAEALSRGRPRAIVSYDRMLRGWGRVVNRAGEALGISWPRGPEQIAEEVAGFLSDDKRHHRRSLEDVVENPLLPAWLRDTTRILDVWSAEGEDPKDYPALDAIRADLDATGLAFAPLITLGQKAVDDLAKTGTAAQEARDKAARLETELADLRDKMEEGRVKRLRLSTDHDEAMKEAARLREELRGRDTDLETLRSTAEAAGTAARQRLEQESLRTRAALDAAEALRADLAAQAAALQAAADGQAALLARMEAEKATAAELLEAEKAHAAALAEADDIKARRIGELKAARNSAEAQVTRLTALLEAESAARETVLAEASRLTAALDAETAARKAGEAQVAALTEADALKAQRIGELKAARDRAETNVTRLSAALEAETAARSTAEAGAAALAEADAAKAARLAALEADHAAALTETARLSAALEAETAARSTAEAGAAALAEADAAKAARLAALEADHAAALTETARLSAALAGLETDIGLLRAEQAQTLAAWEAGRATEAALEAALRGAEGESAILRDRLLELDSALSQRRAEIDDMARLLQTTQEQRDSARQRIAALEADLAQGRDDAAAARTALADSTAHLVQLRQDHAEALAQGRVHEQVAARIEAQIQPLLREMQDSARQHATIQTRLEAEKTALQQESRRLTEAHEARLGDTVRLTELLQLAEQAQQAAIAEQTRLAGRTAELEAAARRKSAAETELEAALKAAGAEQTRLAERNAELEAAARRKSTAETELEAALKAAGAEQTRLAERNAELEAAARRVAMTETGRAELEAAFRATKAEPVQMNAAQSEQAAQSGADIRRIRDALAASPGSRWLPKWSRLRHQMAVVRKTGVFDAAWYLSINTDVAEAKMDPLRHFVKYGMSEGRAPNAGPVRRM